MSETLYIFITLLFTIVDIYAYCRLLNHKLVHRFSYCTHILGFSIAYIFMLLAQYSTELFPNLPLKFPFLLLFWGSLLIIFKAKFLTKLLWIIIAVFIQIICEIIAVPLALLLTRTELIDFLSNSSAHIIGLLLSRILLLTIIEFLVRSKKIIFKDFIKDYFLIILIDVIYSIIISCFFYLENIYLTTDIAIVLSVLVIFLISILALYLLRKITKKSDEIMMTNLKMQQIEMEHKQNQDMAIVVEDLRALRHDMNNHMSVLQGLLTMHAYDDAQSYLSNITEELSVANSFIFTDNKVLSVMLNNKISKARQLGITFDTELLTSITPFSDGDLCAVVGNILENAIEASSKHTNPYILFSMKKLNENLIIECENNYTVTPIFEKGNLITTKSDKAYHGIGTKTIRSVVEDYHGTTEFTVNNMFLVKIVVPM